MNRLTDFVHEMQVDYTRYCICNLVCFTLVVQTCACPLISGSTQGVRHYADNLIVVVSGVAIVLLGLLSFLLSWTRDVLDFARRLGLSSVYFLALLLFLRVR